MRGKRKTTMTSAKYRNKGMTMAVPKGITKSELIVFMANVIAMSKGFDLDELNDNDVLWNRHINLATMIYETLELRVTKDQRSWPCARCGHIYEKRGLADQCLTKHSTETR